MEDVDKIRLFANLLDNAIEAAECVPVQDANGENKRFIHVSILNRGSNFFITVKNSKRTEIAVMENQFHTTKSDAENHGRGVRIIRQIVARYDGTVEFTDKGDTFEVAIML
ncbi:ATP-binding protein [Clostridium sp. AM54-14XD]|nr:ATP-binding protein [Clostridium sp. AM54-14XD]RHP98117.1 ATP-binding protein [Clostridium sp. AM54-14XD]